MERERERKKKEMEEDFVADFKDEAKMAIGQFGQEEVLSSANVEVQMAQK